MPKTRKPNSRFTGTNSPVIQVDLTDEDYGVQLGPFMPFNSGGFAVPNLTSNTVIRSDSTIIIEAPKNK